MQSKGKRSSAQATATDGRQLHGTAAQLRLVSVAGGWDQYHRDIIQYAVNAAVEQCLRHLTSPEAMRLNEPASPEQRAGTTLPTASPGETLTSPTSQSSSSGHVRH